MASLYLLVPIAAAFCFAAIKLLLWAIDDGQYDDLDKEASRILMDEATPSAPVAPHGTARGDRMDSSPDETDKA